jgi:hypothetical protein
MSTAAVSSNSLPPGVQSFLQQRDADLKQLGQALQSGDLAGAQQAFTAIQALSQNNTSANGNSFKVSQRQQDFNAIGQALAAGDLGGAQQAFADLKATVQHGGGPAIDPPAAVVNLSGASAASGSGSSTGSTTGSAIVLNLGNLTPGEQINIGISNGSNGTEQLTVGVTQPGQSSPEQVSLNLNQNSNQQLVLNLFNSTATSAAQGSGVSVSA